jgi:hypothetical protein
MMGFEDELASHYALFATEATKKYTHPPWGNWLARQTVNLEVLSSILSGGGE